MQTFLQTHRLWFLPILSALLLSATIPFTLDVGLFAFIGLMPLFFFSANTKSLRQVFWGGALCGTLYMTTVLSGSFSLNAWWWIDTHGVVWEFRRIFWISSLVVVAFFGQGLLVGLFSYLFRRIYDGSIANSLFLAALWPLGERSREFLLAGSWGHLGYSAHDYGALLQNAAHFGVYGLSFLMVSINILLFSAIHEEKTLQKAVASKYVRIAVILLGCALLFGQYHLHRPAHIQKTMTVAAIHSNYRTEEIIGRKGYETHKTLILQALEAQPSFIVLPENIFPFLIISEETLLPIGYEILHSPVYTIWTDFMNLSKKYPDTALISGLHTRTAEGEHNSVVSIQNGAIVGIYNKQVLIPIAEKTPIFMDDSHFQPIIGGGIHDPLSISGVSVAPLICSELIYPKTLQKSDVVVVVSNDGVFTTHHAAHYNSVIAQFRAVESGTYVVRAAKNGISSIVDEHGIVRVRAQNIEESEVLLGTISIFE